MNIIPSFPFLVKMFFMTPYPSWMMCFIKFTLTSVYLHKQFYCCQSAIYYKSFHKLFCIHQMYKNHAANNICNVENLIFYINVSWVFPVLRINCIENFLLFVTKSNTVGQKHFQLGEDLTSFVMFILHFFQPNFCWSSTMLLNHLNWNGNKQYL